MPDLTGRIEFDVWGCRGSRSFLPALSAIGNHTSCCSLLAGDRVLVLDAGWGLPALGHAMETQRRFRNVRHVDVFVSHAHSDHWEGLKDVGWFWSRGNGLNLRLFGPEQCMKEIELGFAHPSYVPLEILSMGTLASLEKRILDVDQTIELSDDWRLRTFPLNHASGEGENLQRLDTLGYRLEGPGGSPIVCYLLDHEPAPHTLETEIAQVVGSHLAVYDAHFSTIADQRFGHGSQEWAATMARRNPDGIIMAAHHGPMYPDDVLRNNFRRHASGLPNFRLAVEGDRYVWDAPARGFRRHIDRRRGARGSAADLKA